MDNVLKVNNCTPIQYIATFTPYFSCRSAIFHLKLDLLVSLFKQKWSTETAYDIYSSHGGVY
jgi:hypothetical protein